MITGVGHTGIVVRDMEKMVAFYRDMFGFEVVLIRKLMGKKQTV